MKVKVKTQPSCFLEVQQKRFVRREKLSSGDKQSSWEQDNMIWINLSLERQQKSFSVVSLAEKTSCPNIKNIFYKINLFRMDLDDVADTVADVGPDHHLWEALHRLLLYHLHPD